jgi:hypothetical protein
VLVVPAVPQVRFVGAAGVRDLAVEAAGQGEHTERKGTHRFLQSPDARGLSKRGAARTSAAPVDMRVPSVGGHSPAWSFVYGTGMYRATAVED